MPGERSGGGDRGECGKQLIQRLPVGAGEGLDCRGQPHRVQPTGPGHPSRVAGDCSPPPTGSSPAALRSCARGRLGRPTGSRGCLPRPIAVALPADRAVARCVHRQPRPVRGSGLGTEAVGAEEDAGGRALEAHGCWAVETAGPEGPRSCRSPTSRLCSGFTRRTRSIGSGRSADKMPMPRNVVTTRARGRRPAGRTARRCGRGRDGSARSSTSAGSMTVARSRRKSRSASPGRCRPRPVRWHGGRRRGRQVTETGYLERGGQNCDAGGRPHYLHDAPPGCGSQG